MNWYHRVSVPWLKARRDVLTASDVVRLTPEWKRMKAKKLDVDKPLPMFAAVWCEKNTTTEPDPVSTGAAARGHIMEPYAVESFNQWSDVEMHHWDDCIIKNLGLGFSPDAMDVKQVRNDVQCRVSDGGKRLVYDMTIGKTIKSGDRLDAPRSILEIKSYSPAQHMKCILKDKMEHDELMQIAVAFAVLPKLEKATLMFYCPDAPIPVVIYDYCRDELQEQIDMAADIAQLYAAQAIKLIKTAAAFDGIKPICSEAEVWRNEMADAGGIQLR